MPHAPITRRSRKRPATTAPSLGVNIAVSVAETFSPIAHRFAVRQGTTSGLALSPIQGIGSPRQRWHEQRSDDVSNTPPPSHSVLIVEDDAETREYLAAAVSSDPTLRVIGAVRTLREGIALLTQTLTDVLLVDLGLPDGNGTELMRFARRVGSDTQCLVITLFGDEASVISAIKAGARGYLLKDDEAGNICQAIHQLLLGGSPLSPAIARYLLRGFADEADSSGPSPLPKLSERETEILRHVIKGFTFPEIGNLLGISAHTVTTHARRIYRKLEVRSRAEAVFEALSRGWVDIE
jgi:DNA-binding NarL/FixJ family response regulator